MATPTLLRVLLLVLLLLLLARSPEGVAGAAGGGGGGNGTCPLDLSYVSTFPWDPTPCAGGTHNMTACCQTLLSVFSIGLAERLRATGHFRVPSAGASAACLADFAAAIAAPPVSLPGASLVPACFPEPDQFAASPSFCAGVTTAEEYAAVVGSTTRRAFGLRPLCASGLRPLCASAGSPASSPPLCLCAAPALQSSAPRCAGRRPSAPRCAGPPLIINSLYSNKDIFLRELISNASNLLLKRCSLEVASI